MEGLTINGCGRCTAASECVFGQLPDELHREFHDLVEVRRYRADATVVDQDDEAHGIFNVRSGAVRLLHCTADGKNVAVRVVGVGGILGLAEVTGGTPYRTTAETVEDSVFEYVPRRDFVPFLLHNPQLAMELLIWLCQELESLQRGLCDAVSRPAAGRLLQQLRTLGETSGDVTDDGVELHRHFTGQSLAEGLGCSRQWVSKLLGDLEGQGLIERRGRRILLTPSGLGAQGGESSSMTSW